MDAARGQALAGPTCLISGRDHYAVPKKVNWGCSEVRDSYRAKLSQPGFNSNTAMAQISNLQLLETLNAPKWHF